MAALALDKRALWRGIERDLRAGRRARLEEARAAVRTAKARRRTTIAEAKAFCRSAKTSARARAAELEREAKALRASASSGCSSRKGQAAAAAAEVRAAASRKIEVEGAVRGERAVDRAERERRARGRAPRAAARERQGESDDEVRQNIPPELLSLFERVKRQIKGSPRMSRTEAFLHYAEEHPSEAVASIEDATDALIAELEAHARSPESNPRRSRNPGMGMGLVLLGYLTALAWTSPSGRAQHVSWPLERAPMLAYDASGRLHIVYGGHSSGEEASPAARSSYASTHWGDAAHGAVLAGDELRGPFTAREHAGTGTIITYTTQKGGSRVTDYEHEWGEGARGKWRPPAVMRSGARYALSGGTYRVTSRGIVG